MNTLKYAMIGLAGLGVLVMSAPTLGQSTPPSRLYHLRAGSMDEQGCFGACLCPVLLPEPMRGTFVLTPMPISPVLFQDFTVTDVKWQVPFFSQTLTGSGTYEISNAIVPQQQHMALQLSVGGEAAQTFDSGTVPVGSPGFPLIRVHLHVANTICWHTELQVNATPLMGDWNGDGVADIDDIFVFLNGWFAGSGDANEDGVTSLDDIFVFLNGWFSGT